MVAQLFQRISIGNATERLLLLLFCKMKWGQEHMAKRMDNTDENKHTRPAHPGTNCTKSVLNIN